MKRVLVAVLTCFVLFGCKKSDPSAEQHDANAGAADASAQLAAAADAAPRATTFSGKYSVVAGTMYVPSDKDWASVKFKNDETKLLGEGEISLTVEPDGRVAGETTTGPLGASVILGMRDGDALTATVRRKEKADEGLTGTLVATVKGDTLEGTMKLAEFNAAVVRVGKLDAKKK
jgi:hypothetical protein